MPVAYIGIGSNLGNRALYCRNAIGFMRKLPSTRFLKASIFFETKPVDFLDQPDFVNGVVKIETKLKPLELLSKLLDIEKKMGRQRLKKWGPRVIDLDIIDYSGTAFKSIELTLPHPRAFQRDFIVQALNELGFYSSSSSSVLSSCSPSFVSNGQTSKAQPKTKSVSPL